MNDISKARLRLFCILFVVVVAIHILVLRLFFQNQAQTPAKEPKAEAAQTSPSVPAPAVPVAPAAPEKAAVAPAPNPQEKPDVVLPPEKKGKVSLTRSARRSRYFGKPFNFASARALPPKLAAKDRSRAGILIDLDSHNVLWEKKSRQPVPVASMVKMMTMLLTCEALERNPKLSLDSKVEITRSAGNYFNKKKIRREGVMWLDPKESFPLQDLLKAMMIRSANDAALQVAEFIGGSIENFTGEMNRRAAELKMTGTKYLNPCGLPENRHNSLSSVYDMSILAEQLLQYPQILAWSSQRTGSIDRPMAAKKEYRKSIFNNTNGLIRSQVSGVDGLKTGYTNAAGFCLTFSALRSGHRLVGCVTGFSNQKERDLFCSELLDWGYARLGVKTPQKRGQNKSSVKSRRRQTQKSSGKK